MSKPKNISFAKIKRQAKETQKMESYDLNETDRIRFYPIFPQSKINELIKELIDIIIQAHEKDVVFSEEQLIEHIYFLCIKHFTHLKKEISDKYDEQLQQMEYLIDSGLYRTIINDVFMTEELYKVLDSIGDVLATQNFIQFAESNMLNRLEELKVKNKNVLNLLSDQEVERIRKKYEKKLKQ